MVDNDKSINYYKKAAGIPYSLSLGIEVPHTPSNLRQAVRDIENDYYDYAIVNIFHEMNLRDSKTIETRQIAHTMSDTVISSQYWQGFIVAKISSHFVNCDSPFEHVRARSEAIVTQEIDFAIHLGIEKIVVDLPGLQDCPNIDNLARILNRYLEDVHVVQKFILKITIPPSDAEAEKMYTRFLRFKQLCNHNTNVQAILALQPNLPSEPLLKRFWGEGVFAVQVSSDAFIINQSQYPVLPKALQ